MPGKAPLAIAVGASRGEPGGQFPRRILRLGAVRDSPRLGQRGSGHVYQLGSGSLFDSAYWMELVMLTPFLVGRFIPR